MKKEILNYENYLIYDDGNVFNIPLMELYCIDVAHIFLFNMN